MNFVDICKLPQEKLKVRLEAELTALGYEVVNEDGFLYAEGDVPVMLTAHMDTVHHDNCTIVCTSEDGNVVMSPQGIGGDDRCGIYMCLRILETHHCSVLFTEDEEIGCVGAHKFTKTDYKPKQLNYIIEFDRKNANDAVFYDCDNKDFEEFITTDTGFKTAYGSCSDISYVAPHLRVAAVNFSCGYYNPHTQHEYVKYDEMNTNIERAIAIIDKPCDKPFEYIEKVKTMSYYSNWGYSHYFDKKSSKVSSDYKSYNYKDYEDTEEISPWVEKYYKEMYGVEKEPEVKILNVIEAMPLEPNEVYLKDSEGNYYYIDEYEYYMDKDGNVYYTGGTLYMGYMIDGKAFDLYNDNPVKFQPDSVLDIAEISACTWEAIQKYYENLVDLDYETGSECAEEYLITLEEMALAVDNA